MGNLLLEQLEVWMRGVEHKRSCARRTEARGHERKILPELSATISYVGVSSIRVLIVSDSR